MVRQRGRQGIGLLGRHYQIHVETSRGLHEVLRAVRRGGNEQE